MADLPPDKHEAVSRLPLFLLLATLSALSVLDLNGFQAAMLFLLIAITLVLLTYRTEVLISPLVFLIAAYTLAYPMAILFPGLYASLWEEVKPDALDYGMLWALRGFCAFALGYGLVEHFGNSAEEEGRRDEASYRDSIDYTVYALTCIGWLAMSAWAASIVLFGISLTFIEGNNVSADSAAGTLQQLLSLLAGLRHPFFLGYVMLQFWKEANKHLALLCTALLVITLIEIVTIGSKASVISGLVVGLLALAFLPIRVTLKQIIISCTALVCVYGSFVVITEYRAIMHEEETIGGDVFDFAVQVESFGTAVRNSLSFSESALVRRTEMEDVFSRFGDGIFSFSNLLESTDRHSPYEYAWESLMVPVYSVAPRALLTEKPEFFSAGRNAREYYRWAYGGISVTLLGSFYFAWGYSGIILGMAFLGGLLSYVVNKARLSGISSPDWLILLVALTVPLLDVGGTFQAVTTNVIRVAIVLGLLHVLYPLVRGAVRPRMGRGVSKTQRGGHA